MDLSEAASPSEKAPEPDTAEEICELLAQTMLKYFPQEGNNSDRPRSSVPLVPQPETPVSERKRWSLMVDQEK